MVDSLDIQRWCQEKLHWDIADFMFNEPQFSHQVCVMDAPLDCNSPEGQYYRRLYHELVHGFPEGATAAGGEDQQGRAVGITSVVDVDEVVRRGPLGRRLLEE